METNRRKRFSLSFTLPQADISTPRDSYHERKGGIRMKEQLQVRSSFTAPGKEQLKQSVTKKIEKIANKKMRKAG